MAKAFSSEQLQALNASSKTGRFVEAAVFTRDDEGNKDYFIRYNRPMIFKGNTYQPLSMVWDGISVSAKMELPSNKVSIPDMGGMVIDFIEENNIDIEGNDVLLQILFIDRYEKITLIDEMLFQVEVLLADYNSAITINLGVNYSLNDIIPSNTLELQEFPGLKQDAIRVGT